MQTTLGIGRALRVERERKRLSLEIIARATMVNRKHLEAIDDDRFDELPCGAYAKGFIRAYANYLGLDPLPYIRAYEERCEGAQGAELSSFKLEPVRVPRAVEPRAWRMAFAAAVAVMVLLGMIGALGSDEAPADPPDQVELALVNTPSEDLLGDDFEAAEVLGPVVRVEALEGRVWLGAHADGEKVHEGFLEPGQKQTFTGKEMVYLVVGNARSARIFANGHEVGTPLEDTYRGTFSARTTDLPPSQPQ